MTDDATQESIRNLNRLSQDGSFDKVLASARRGNPMLEELGLTADRLQEGLNAPLDRLESVGMFATELEAIVEIIGRPPLVVQNDKVVGKTTIGDIFPDNIAGKITGVEKFLPSVGRLEFINHDRVWDGTGWVIDEDGPDHLLVVTNRHVAAKVARRTFRGDAVFAFGPGNIRYGAQIDFGEEFDVASDPAKTFRIDSFTYLADDISADVAIGRIARPADPSVITPLPLADQDGAEGETVGLIGYPAYDSRNAHVYMERYFKGLYDVKRFAPGFLKPGGALEVLSHDCTSLGGNSGSPLLSLDQKKVVGLHFAGKYRVGNSAVRVSSLKAILSGARPVHAGAALPAGETADEARDRTHPPEFFAGRTGYDPSFLLVADVPLPRLPDHLDLARPSDATPERPHELKYQHFGILYSAANKGPAVAAFNLDGGQFRAIKRHNSTWYHDLRIPREIQLDREDYGDSKIDRGHLVRRFATNWGETEEEAQRANLDSYHYTNASPQHASFNRSRERWLGLENYILENSRTYGFRANVFTGPIYTPDDRELGNTGAPLPANFFKLVTMLAEDSDEVVRLHATAYVLSQGQFINDLLRGMGVTETAEGFEYGAFKTFQVRVSDLEAMTGYDFGDLRDFDPLARAAGEESAMARKPVVEIDYFEQIRI